MPKSGKNTTLAPMSNFSYFCPHCKLPVLENQNSIYCDSCNNWIHRRCSGLSIHRFNELGYDTSSTWFCQICVADTMPFQKLSKSQFFSEILANQRKYNSIKELNRSCHNCNICVNNSEKAAPCYQCWCYIHRKCSFLSDKQISDLNFTSEQWFCINCRSNIFPFHSTQDILLDGFNSNELCSEATKDLTGYECLETITDLKLDKLDLNHFHPNTDNDIDQNLNLNTNFKYYTTHEFQNWVGN